MCVDFYLKPKATEILEQREQYQACLNSAETSGLAECNARLA